MTWLGDFPLGATLDFKFCTVQVSGAPTTLSGSPVISAYPDNSTTEVTAGITLTVDFDGRTGLNNVRIVATGANGYLQGSNYTLVITTGTVNSVSAVGYVVGSFSIQNRSNSLMGAGVGAFPPLGIVDSGTLQSATGTTAVIRSAAAFATSELVGTTILITGGTGAGQARAVTANVGSSDTVTVDAWTTNPDSTSTYVIFGTAPGSTTSPVPALVQGFLTTAFTEGATGRIAAAFKQFFNVASPASTMELITALTSLTNAATAGDLTAAMKTSVQTAAAAALAAYDTTGVAKESSAQSIKAKTDNLPSDPADASDIAAATAALQADTDNIQTRLPAALTTGGRMKVSVEAVKDIALSGDGNATPFHV